MNGDRTTQLSLVNLADEVIVNRSGSTARIPVGELAMQLSQVPGVSPSIASIAALGSEAGLMLYTTAPDTWAEAPISAAGRALLDDADAAAQRSTLGLGAVSAIAEVATDLNNILVSGWTRFAPTAANSPFGNKYGFALTMVGTYGDSALQLVFGHNGSDSNTLQWIRWRAAGIWGAWVRLYGSASEIKSLSVGAGQAWMNMSASRAANTSYQNTSGRPIMVALRLSNVAGSDLQVSGDGTSWLTVVFAGAQEAIAATIIVPDGHYYKVLNGYFSGTWRELR